MKLELKHLAPYLPYGAKILYNGDNTVRELLLLDTCRDSYEHIFKPLLIPLSEIPQELFQKSGFSTVNMMLSAIDRQFVPVWFWNDLLKLHFDVFNLIPQGLALNKLNYIV